MKIKRYLDKETPKERETYDLIDSLIMERNYTDALTATIRYQKLMDSKMYHQYKDGLAEKLIEERQENENSIK